MFKNILLTIPLLLILACSEEEFGDKKKGPEPIIQAKNIGSNEFSYSIEPMEDPNKYKIFINWPETTNQVEVEVEGKTLKKTKSGETFFDGIFDGGKIYRFGLTAIQNESKLFRTTLEIKVPLDVVLSGKQEISGLRKIIANRLFIKKDAHLISYNNTIDIEAEEIYSSGGTLQNYPQGMISCQQGVWTGYSGGDILIKAKRAFGDLNIIMGGASACRSVCYYGGDGGNLKIQIKDGSSLKLNNSFFQGLGSHNNIGQDCFWKLGAKTNTCISLSEGEGRDCFAN